MSASCLYLRGRPTSGGGADATDVPRSGRHGRSEGESGGPPRAAARIVRGAGACRGVGGAAPPRMPRGSSAGRERVRGTSPPRMPRETKTAFEMNLAAAVGVRLKATAKPGATGGGSAPLVVRSEFRNFVDRGVEVDVRRLLSDFLRRQRHGCGVVRRRRRLGARRAGLGREAPSVLSPSRARRLVDLAAADAGDAAGARRRAALGGSVSGSRLRRQELVMELVCWPQLLVSTRRLSAPHATRVSSAASAREGQHVAEA